MHTHRVLLDTDPGIDDALTFLLAIASPEIELLSATIVAGNCPLSDSVRNALNILHLVQAAHIPVAAGADRPLLRPAVFAAETHGDTGLGYARLPTAPTTAVAEHAVDLLIREILLYPGEITLVAIGPLTNLALAVRKEPRIVQAVKQVIIMGGALRVDGNVTPLAEFNVYVDPHAAHIVLHSGFPITLLPWDITRDVLLTYETVEMFQHIPGPLPPFIKDLTRFYIEFHREYFGYAGCSINDPAALALVMWPDLAQLQPVYVDVELTSELTMGKTVGDFGQQTSYAPNVQLVTAFDTPRFLQMFCERMEQLAWQLAQPQAH